MFSTLNPIRTLFISLGYLRSNHKTTIMILIMKKKTKKPTLVHYPTFGAISYTFNLTAKASVFHII